MSALAATQLSKRYDVKTSLAVPVNLQSIEEAAAVIADLGSPPLRVSVARDLARAFETAELRPLLESTLETEIALTDDDLEARRKELQEAGPTISWPDFPPKPPKGTVHRGRPVAGSRA